MNNTLDRLKALNNKLEKKLSEKKRQSPKTIKKQSVGEEAEASKKEDSTTKGEQGTDQSSNNRPALVTEEQGENCVLLHHRLLSHLKIDTVAEPVRSENLFRVAELYQKLQIDKKVPDIEDIFIYKAMNISGIGLKDEDFGEIREGKYVQVIAITYEPDKNGKKKAKNISLGYFGKAETLESGRKNEVIEFVLRWRYEKAFQNLEHYRLLLEKVCPEEILS